MSAIYAVGDVHGQRAKLAEAHALIERDRAAHGAAGAPVVHLGDLVDRGPDSRGVIEDLIAGQAEGRPWIVLRGNHDAMFARFLHDPADPDPRLFRELTWWHERLGGAETLRSYGVRGVGLKPIAWVHREALAAVPQAHRDWIEALPLWHEAETEEGPVLFVHAGIRPGVPLAAQDEEDLIWIRHGFTDDPTPHPWLVVHGHTALEAPTHFGNRIDLDSGAGYGGPLTAAVFEGRRAYVLTPQGPRAAHRLSPGLPRQPERRLQRVAAPDVVGQDQHQPRVERAAPFGVQPRMGGQERGVEPVRILEVGLGHEAHAPSSTAFIAAATVAASASRQRAATTWSGRTR